jgi:c-di-GMP-related signal transduction protein
MDAFVARQPIFHGSKKLFAYELLFRTGMSNAFPGIDGGIATSSLLSSSFFTVGIERISGGKLVFINFTEELLCRGVPTLFPKSEIVVEILEDVQPTEEVVEACRDLQQKGYLLALDDFVFRDNLQPLIDMARIIKIDFRLTPLEEIAEMLNRIKGGRCRFLAEKIETHEEFLEAKALGFHYFQGYFFAKPEILKNREVSPSQLTVARLICEVNRQDMEFRQLEELINQDVAISFKLINYLNSAYFGRMHPVSSIRQAVAFLGERGVRMFVSLIVASRLVEQKPDELLRLSAIRGKFLEQVAISLGLNEGELFMLGLFSLLDAMLDNPMEALVGRLPLSAEVREALVQRSGGLAPFLLLVEAYEQCHWSEVDLRLKQLQLDPEKIQAFYLDAVRLADIL